MQRKIFPFVRGSEGGEGVMGGFRLLWGPNWCKFSKCFQIFKGKIIFFPNMLTFWRGEGLKSQKVENSTFFIYFFFLPLPLGSGLFPSCFSFWWECIQDFNFFCLGIPVPSVSVELELHFFSSRALAETFMYYILYHIWIICIIFGIFHPSLQTKNNFSVQ